MRLEPRFVPTEELKPSLLRAAFRLRLRREKRSLIISTFFRVNFLFLTKTTIREFTRGGGSNACLGTGFLSETSAESCAMTETARQFRSPGLTVIFLAKSS